MADITFAGPVDCLVFAFPPAAPVADGLGAVLASARAGTIELLDIECVRRDAEGRPTAIPLAQLAADAPGLDVSEFDGADSGILDADDLSQIAADLPNGGFAIAVVYEDRSLAAAASAWAAAGGPEVLSGGVDMTALARIVGEKD